MEQVDSTEVRETRMVIGYSHARWRAAHCKPHLTKSDVRLKVAQPPSAPHQNGLSGTFERSECAGFRYYDVLHLPNGDRHYLKVRSLVGLIPLLAVETLEQDIVDRLPGFKRRMQWFIDNHPDVPEHIETVEHKGKGVRRLLSLVNRGQLESVARYLLNESEFLSPYGIRAISKFHKDNPYVFRTNGTEHRVDYEPAESSTGLFGGNSNWRGPVWFPINFLLIEALQKFHHFYGDGFTVELPTGSGRSATLWQAAAEISRRLTKIFLRSSDGTRPVYGGLEKFQQDPHWRDLIYFHEYFHGDNGAGIGASHQTGWTGLVSKLIEQSGEGM